MKNKSLIVVLLLAFLFIRPREVAAAIASCQSPFFGFQIKGFPTVVNDKDSYFLEITPTNPDDFQDGKTYQLEFSAKASGTFSGSVDSKYDASVGKLIFDVNPKSSTFATEVGNHGATEQVFVRLTKKWLSRDICSLGSYEVTKNIDPQSENGLIIKNLQIKSDSGFTCLDSQTHTFVVSGSVVHRDGTPLDTGFLRLNSLSFKMIGPHSLPTTDDYFIRADNFSVPFNAYNFSSLDPGGDYYLVIKILNTGYEFPPIPLPVQFSKCTTDSDDMKRSLTLATTGFKTQGFKGIRPEECKTDGSSKDGLNTALGCIPTDIGKFVSWFLRFAISLGGGVSFILLAAGAFIFMTSGGNPEQIKKGQQIIVSALSGILFIIFATFLLQLIGMDILQIPGFTN